MDISDGDLVRLARDGDPVAFRLLVERYQAMARARAADLSRNRSDVDDIVQESFLQAFVALDRLRDPDRFAGWLAGIVVNVSRNLQRRTGPVLLPEWPEQLHPAAAAAVPSADDLDRAAAVRAAVADLPAGQRRAVALYYYADQPADQIGESPGAARASLHKARLRLRAYIAEHRPDLIPAASRRTQMTSVRIARAEHRARPRPSAAGSRAQLSGRARRQRRRPGAADLAAGIRPPAARAGSSSGTRLARRRPRPRMTSPRNCFARPTHG